MAVEVVSPCLALESRTDAALQSRLDRLCPREPWKAQRPSPAHQLPESCTLGVRMQSAIAHAVVRDPASDGQGSRPRPPQPHPLAPRPSPLARGTPRRRGRSRCRRGSATPAGPPGRKRQGSHATSAPADGVRTHAPQNGHQLPELLWAQPAEQGHPRRRPHPAPPHPRRRPRAFASPSPCHRRRPGPGMPLSPVRSRNSAQESSLIGELRVQVREKSAQQAMQDIDLLRTEPVERPVVRVQERRMGQGSFVCPSAVSEIKLTRRSFGSDARSTSPSRSIRASSCAMDGCSIRASRASSFWDSGPPCPRAASTGTCPKASPSGRRRRSLTLASTRAAVLTRVVGGELGVGSITCTAYRNLCIVDA